MLEIQGESERCPGVHSHLLVASSREHVTDIRLGHTVSVCCASKYPIIAWVDRRIVDCLRERNQNLSTEQSYGLPLLLRGGGIELSPGTREASVDTIHPVGSRSATGLGLAMRPAAAAIGDANSPRT